MSIAKEAIKGNDITMNNQPTITLHKLWTKDFISTEVNLEGEKIGEEINEKEMLIGYRVDIDDGVDNETRYYIDFYKSEGDILDDIVSDYPEDEYVYA